MMDERVIVAGASALFSTVGTLVLMYLFPVS